MNTKQQSRHPRPTWRQYNELKREYKELWAEFAQLVNERVKLEKLLQVERMMRDSLEKANQSNHEAGLRYLDIISRLAEKSTDKQTVLHA
jgi:tRNA nucleotidyltransferase/poly(A) polymerase